MRSVNYQKPVHFILVPSPPICFYIGKSSPSQILCSGLSLRFTGLQDSAMVK